MGWRRVSFSAEEVVSGDHMALQDEFKRLFFDAGAPADAALFALVVEKAQQYELFFSPVTMTFAAGLIEMYHGVPCLPPDPSVMLVVGGVNAWKTLTY